MEAISKITDIGQIPSDWNIKTIEQLFENGFQNGVFFEVDRKGKGIPIVNVSDLYGSVPIDGKKLEKFNATEKEIKRFIVHKGDLFFTRSSVVPAGIAMCNVYDDKDENGAVFDSHVIKLSVNQQEVNSLFLCLQCRMPYCRSFFIANSKTAIMTTIDQKSLAKCPIPMPQLSEQDDIVGTIRRFDTYIDDLVELIEKKGGIRDGALEDLIRRRSRLDGFNGEWTTVSFNQVITPKARIGWQGLKKHEYLRSGYSYLIGGTDFSHGNVSLDNIWYVSKDRYDMDANIQVSENDVLVTKDGTIGKVALVPELGKPATLNSGVFVFRTNNRLLPTFLFRVLSSSVFREFIDTLSAGSTIKHLYQKDLKNFEFEIPVDKKEQEAIADTLTAMDEEIEALKIERDKMIQIREGAMDDLLMGRVRLSI